MQKLTRSLLLTCALFLPLFAHNVKACTIFENVYESLPFNGYELTNAIRVEIAEKVIRAREWPDVAIGADVSTPALWTETHPSQLAAARAKNVRAYLVQLGLDDANIFIDAPVIKNPFVVGADGLERLRNITVMIMPICEGGCDRLCNNPRVTPASKIIH